ncbi:RBP11-like subunits of RNA polymerase [Glarea lozoyensis ATCC 20868]|uniref:DNA-directed RNA polymerases I and III subunit RPAC2 n=1 Tax=Glarea lozoyensis (strain ATCC 20868 / MF5171) TaxID=1116229 RepID=S3E6V5_GLAL2|nr:RBP11-like subunits of RNA polymerase [Glarea lozoyensis ATCC 20868]EPE34098.1 RBP11-like subunits of RNA polymerase [Glarea lozoyensis ATCC 20868]
MAPKNSKKAAEAAPPAPESDVEMDYGSPSNEVLIDENSPQELAKKEQRIRVLPGSSATAASFEFKDEDHTLGNALRYIIMKNPEVEFCGYSIPHPSEPLMNIRIQTYEGTTASEALEKGFKDLMDLCDVVADKFVEAQIEFAEENPTEV